MTSTKSEAAAAVRIGAGLALRKRNELLGLLRPCFARTEPWLQAGKYVSALVSAMPRVNGWSIARHGRDRTPDRTQRLLNHASWDTSAAMSVMRRFAAKGLDAAARRRAGMVIPTCPACGCGYGPLDGGLRPSGQTSGDEGRDRVRRLWAARDVGPWVARPAARIVNQEVIEMLILVASASKHGATRGIAERSTKTGDGRARGSYATVA